jgi:flagellar capping protein FliD
MTTGAENKNDMAETTPLTFHRVMEMMAAGLIPNIQYLDSRFELMQVLVKHLSKDMDNFNSQIRHYEDRVDRRFEQCDQKFDEFKRHVDKRFDQMIAAISRLSEK